MLVNLKIVIVPFLNFEIVHYFIFPGFAHLYFCILVV